MAQLAPLPTGWKYGDFLDYFAKRMHKTSPTHRETVLRPALKDVIDEICSRWEWTWLRRSSTITTIKDLAEYSIEADAAYLIGDMHIDNVQTLRHRSLTEVRRLNAQDTGTTIPSTFALTGPNTVLMAKTPGAAYTVLYDYRVLLPDASGQFADDLTPPWNQNIDHVLIRGMEEKLRLDDDRNDRATATAISRYEGAVLRAVFNDSRGSRVTRRPDVLPPGAG